MKRKGCRGYTLVELMIAMALVAGVVGLFVVGARGCSSEDGRARAIRAAEVGGLNDVRVTDEHWVGAGFYGCSKGDGVAYEVVGRDRHEKPVDAVVCCGGPLSFKACTFRVK